MTPPPTTPKRIDTKQLRENLEEIVQDLHSCGYNQRVDCPGYNDEIEQILALLDSQREEYKGMIEKLCNDYDEENGVYPEHKFEGKAFWEFIKAKL